MNYSFTIIKKDWYKRRKPTQTEVKALSVFIPDYQPVHNYMCRMFVNYEDKSVKELIARVILNKQTGRWTVDGMAVAVSVSEVNDRDFKGNVVNAVKVN